MPTRAPHLRARWSRPRWRAAVVVSVLALIGLAATLVVRVFTDWLWFEEVGHERVFRTLLTTRWLTAVAAGLAAAGVLAANLWLVRRIAPAPARAAGSRTRTLRRALVPAYLGVATVVGLSVGRDVAGGDWRLLLLWRHRSDFGTTDPLFHRDVGFFVFSLPLEQRLATWLVAGLAVTLAATIAAHGVTGAIRLGAAGLTATRGAHVHLVLLGALLLVTTAWQHRLSQFALALPHEGAAANGAGYTDVHVRLPWLKVLVLIAMAGAALLVYAALRRSRSLPAFVVIVVVCAEVVNPSIVPSVIQRLAVDPQTLGRERPYIADSIRMTRLAYGLDGVDRQPVRADGRISGADLRANRDVLRDIQLWDPRILRDEVDQQQSLGAYYRFGRITVDRYRDRSGRRTTMLVAPRQLDLRQVAGRGRTWANDRLAYTHGYGLVAVAAGGVDAAGKPRLATSDFGASGPPVLLRQPRIYYGEQPRGAEPWVIVRSARGEVEKPEAGEARTAKYHYDDRGGIPLGGRLRRAVFAFREGDLNLLLSKTIGPRSRILLHRDVRDRLRTLAPFLRWKDEPELVVVGGRMQFLLHGYTSSDSFPYAARLHVAGTSVNYLRAPVDATVDATSGRMTLYATGEGDPVLRAWRAAFPTLFTPGARMPPELRRHLRYPQRLFAVQSRIWATYHADDVDRFYADADALRRPPDISGRVQRVGTLGNRTHRQAPVADPEFVLGRLPGERARRFMLTTPLTPHNQENLSSYLTGHVRSSGRPELTELSLPRSRPVLGPSQASRQIFASTAVSERLRLLNQETTDLGDRAVNTVELGRLRMVPVGAGFLYVQPFYVTSQAAGITKLRLVGVHLNGKVGHGRTLAEAIRRARAAA